MLRVLAIWLYWRGVFIFFRGLLAVFKKKCGIVLHCCDKSYIFAEN